MGCVLRVAGCGFKEDSAWVEARDWYFVRVIVIILRTHNTICSFCVLLLASCMLTCTSESIRFCC